MTDVQYIVGILGFVVGTLMVHTILLSLIYFELKRKP